MKLKLSRTGTFFIVSLLLVGLLWGLFFANPRLMQNLNNMLIDTAFAIRGPTPVDKRIIIVDVDEKSLHELGQWPWSRNKIATLLQNLTDAGAAIIGLDMVFAEPDASSPARIAKAVHLKAKNLPDYDTILARTLQQTPVVAGYTFDFENRRPGTLPPTDAIYIEHGKTTDTLPRPRGVTPNIPIIQQSAMSSGSFNTFPDPDGIVRHVPLLFAWDDTLYPSLSFEMIRLLLGVRKVDIFYDENGVTQINPAPLQIPVNAGGKLFVNYHGPGKSYPYLSATDIVAKRFDPAAVKEKIILLGTSAAGLLDLRATPFDTAYPGVEVHATVLDNIINDDMIAENASLSSLVTLIAVAAIVLTVALIIQLTPPATALPLIFATASGGAYLLYYELFSAHRLYNFAYPLVALLASVFLFTFMKVYFENRQKKVIEAKFAKKVSPQVAKALLKHPDDIFAVTEAEITIFFSDVRNFTTISESLNDPKRLIAYLNRYMSPMSEIIIETHGTIDKYIGDAIMAYWNAPLPVRDHEDQAVTAALRQLETLEKLNPELQKSGYPPIDIGIGIHTGTAIVGEMGSSGRSDYTVIGDSVNLASRIEGLCKTYGAKILISEATFRKLRRQYRIREVDHVRVKGKKEAVTLYEVLGAGSFSDEEAVLHKRYLHALRLYRNARFTEARRLFEKLYEERPHKLFKLYTERCRDYEKRPIKDFDAIYRFTQK